MSVRASGAMPPSDDLFIKLSNFDQQSSKGKTVWIEGSEGNRKIMSGTEWQKNHSGFRKFLCVITLGIYSGAQNLGKFDDVKSAFTKADQYSPKEQKALCTFLYAVCKTETMKIDEATQLAESLHNNKKEVIPEIASKMLKEVRDGKKNFANFKSEVESLFASLNVTTTPTREAQKTVTAVQARLQGDADRDAVSPPTVPSVSEEPGSAQGTVTDEAEQAKRKAAEDAERLAREKAEQERAEAEEAAREAAREPIDYPSAVENLTRQIELLSNSLAESISKHEDTLRPLDKIFGQDFVKGLKELAGKEGMEGHINAAKELLNSEKLKQFKPQDLREALKAAAAFEEIIIPPAPTFDAPEPVEQREESAPPTRAPSAQPVPGGPDLAAGLKAELEKRQQAKKRETVEPPIAQKPTMQQALTGAMGARRAVYEESAKEQGEKISKEQLAGLKGIYQDDGKMKLLEEYAAIKNLLLKSKFKEATEKTRLSDDEQSEIDNLITIGELLGQADIKQALEESQKLTQAPAEPALTDLFESVKKRIELQATLKGRKELDIQGIGEALRDLPFALADRKKAIQSYEAVMQIRETAQKMKVDPQLAKITSIFTFAKPYLDSMAELQIPTFTDREKFDAWAEKVKERAKLLDELSALSGKMPKEFFGIEKPTPQLFIQHILKQDSWKAGWEKFNSAAKRMGKSLDVEKLAFLSKPDSGHTFADVQGEQVVEVGLWKPFFTLQKSLLADTVSTAPGKEDYLPSEEYSKVLSSMMERFKGGLHFTESEPFKLFANPPENFLVPDLTKNLKLINEGLKWTDTTGIAFKEAPKGAKAPSKSVGVEQTGEGGQEKSVSGVLGAMKAKMAQFAPRVPVSLSSGSDDEWDDVSAPVQQTKTGEAEAAEKALAKQKTISSLRESLSAAYTKAGLPAKVPNEITPRELLLEARKEHIEKLIGNFAQNADEQPLKDLQEAIRQFEYVPAWLNLQEENFVGAQRKLNAYEVAQAEGTLTGNERQVALAATNLKNARSELDKVAKYIKGLGEKPKLAVRDSTLPQLLQTYSQAKSVVSLLSLQITKKEAERVSKEAEAELLAQEAPTQAAHEPEPTVKIKQTVAEAAEQLAQEYLSDFQLAIVFQEKELVSEINKLRSREDQFDVAPLKTNIDLVANDKEKVDRRDFTSLEIEDFGNNLNAIREGNDEIVSECEQQLDDFLRTLDKQPPQIQEKAKSLFANINFPETKLLDFLRKNPNRVEDVKQLLVLKQQATPLKG